MNKDNKNTGYYFMLCGVIMIFTGMNSYIVYDQVMYTPIALMGVTFIILGLNNIYIEDKNEELGKKIFRIAIALQMVATVAIVVLSFI